LRATVDAASQDLRDAEALAARMAR
jgi:hypothetical protein